MKLQTGLKLLLALCVVSLSLQAKAQQNTAQQMIKFAAIWEVPGDNTLLDQWYRRKHSQETIEAVGPWLTRYWTYRAYDVPADIDHLNVVRYRLTEMWYDSVASRDESQRSFYPLSSPPTDPTRYPRKTRIAQITVPAIPTEKFLDAMPRDRISHMRWVFFMRYPKGVSVADGERWFLNVHAPELQKLAGLKRFVSYKSLTPEARADSWVRMCELWFDDYATWRKAVLESPPKFTAPVWNKAFPFADVVTIFTDQQADMDFLREYYRIP